MIVKCSSSYCIVNVHTHTKETDNNLLHHKTLPHYSTKTDKKSMVLLPMSCYGAGEPCYGMLHCTAEGY